MNLWLDCSKFTSLSQKSQHEQLLKRYKHLEFQGKKRFVSCERGSVDSLLEVLAKYSMAGIRLLTITPWDFPLWTSWVCRFIYFFLSCSWKKIQYSGFGSLTSDDLSKNKPYLTATYLVSFCHCSTWILISSRRNRDSVQVFERITRLRNSWTLYGARWLAERCVNLTPYVRGGGCRGGRVVVVFREIFSCAVRQSRCGRPSFLFS